MSQSQNSDKKHPIQDVEKKGKSRPEEATFDDPLDGELLSDEELSNVSGSAIEDSSHLHQDLSYHPLSDRSAPTQPSPTFPTPSHLEE